MLPTGFGKSQIFTSVSETETRRNSKMASAVFLVIAPLNSIIEDQFADLNSKGYRATTLSSLKLDNLKDLHVDIIFGSAEEALSSELRGLQGYISDSVILLLMNAIQWKLII